MECWELRIMWNVLGILYIGENVKWNTWNGLEQDGVAWNGMGSNKMECWEHRIIWNVLEKKLMA